MTQNIKLVSIKTWKWFTPWCLGHSISFEEMNQWKIMIKHIFIMHVRMNPHVLYSVKQCCSFIIYMSYSRTKWDSVVVVSRHPGTTNISPIDICIYVNSSTIVRQTSSGGIVNHWNFVYHTEYGIPWWYIRPLTQITWQIMGTAHPPNLSPASCVIISPCLLIFLDRFSNVFNFRRKSCSMGVWFSCICKKPM